MTYSEIYPLNTGLSSLALRAGAVGSSSSLLPYDEKSSSSSSSSRKRVTSYGTPTPLFATPNGEVFFTDAKGLFILFIYYHPNHLIYNIT
jgi:hypothetical protein